MLGCIRAKLPCLARKTEVLQLGSLKAFRNYKVKPQLDNFEGYSLTALRPGDRIDSDLGTWTQEEVTRLGELWTQEAVRVEGVLKK